MRINGLNKSNHRRVLVLGDDDRSFLSVIRSLGRRGIEIHTGWCPPGSPALASRYIAENHEIRPYVQEDRSWIDDIRSILIDKPFDLVIPCSDKVIIPLRRGIEEISRHSLIYLLPDDIYRTVADKTRTTVLARSLGVPVPEEIEIQSKENALEAAEIFGFPIILKPVISFSEADPSMRNRVRTARSRAELGKIVETMLLGSRFIGQKFYEGNGTGIEILAHSGRILFAFQHLRIHEPVGGGGSSYRKSIPLDGNMLDAVEKMVSALDYTGVAMFEFKSDKDFRSWRLLEINGRFWGSLPLALACGADFPWYLYEMLINGRKDFDQDYSTGIYCRNLINDIGWNLSNLRNDRSDPKLNTIPLRLVAAEAINILTLRERSDTFVLDDPKPGFHQLAWLIRSVFERISEHVKIKCFQMGKTDARNLELMIPRLSKIHFVCKGNICRSPFAEYYARSVLPAEMEVSSSGYLEPAGRRPPPEAVRASEELGIDIIGHRSSIVDERVLTNQDVILVFDEKTYRKLSTRFPGTSARLFRIGSLADPSRPEIRDPFGEDLTEFRKIYGIIKRAIDRIGEIASGRPMSC
jgi:protein-tyrosine-phosphatase/predicted ATP-grasp superfamily ATP-dependent carboligase